MRSLLRAGQGKEEAAQRIMDEVEAAVERMRAEPNRDRVTAAMRGEALEPTRDAIKARAHATHRIHPGQSHHSGT